MTPSPSRSSLNRDGSSEEHYDYQGGVIRTSACDSLEDELKLNGALRHHFPQNAAAPIHLLEEELKLNGALGLNHRRNDNRLRRRLKKN